MPRSSGIAPRPRVRLHRKILDAKKKLEVSHVQPSAINVCDARNTFRQRGYRMGLEEEQVFICRVACDL